MAGEAAPQRPHFSLGLDLGADHRCDNADGQHQQEDEDTCALFQQVIRSKGVQCSIRPGESRERASRPETKQNEQGSVASDGSERRKVPQIEEMSSTLEQLQTLCVSSGQAALTPRKAGKASASGRDNPAAAAPLSGRKPLTRSALKAAAASAPVAAPASIDNDITPPFANSVLPPVIPPPPSGYGSAASRALSPGTAQLLSKVYGAAAVERRPLGGDSVGSEVPSTSRGMAPQALPSARRIGDAEYNALPAFCRSQLPVAALEEGLSQLLHLVTGR